MFVPGKDRVEFVRSQIRQHAQRVSGSPDLAVGIELASLVKMVAGLYEVIGAQQLGGAELSAARWRLLMRLLAEEEHGSAGGLTPTYLSRFAHVSKNTVSALLRGLEEQGLIERALDPKDHRLFHIRLTSDGRGLIRSTAPKWIAYLNALVVDLTAEEQAILADLLEKLYRSLLAHSRLAGRSHLDERAGT